MYHLIDSIHIKLRNSRHGSVGSEGSDYPLGVICVITRGCVKASAMPAMFCVGAGCTNEFILWILIELYTLDLNICYTSINLSRENSNMQITSELISPLGKGKSHILVSSTGLSAQSLRVENNVTLRSLNWTSFVFWVPLLSLLPNTHLILLEMEAISVQPASPSSLGHIVRYRGFIFQHIFFSGGVGVIIQPIAIYQDPISKYGHIHRYQELELQNIFEGHKSVWIPENCQDAGFLTPQAKIQFQEIFGWVSEH